MAETRSSAMEGVIAAIWGSELQTSVQSDSDFFALGGDSLRMLNMLFRVSRAVGMDIPPGVLFEASTLHEFACRVESARSAEGISAHLIEGTI